MPKPDLAQLLFGQNAVHVPAWLYVQNHGDGTVSFVGSSRVALPHPLRYGSERTHQLIVGELVVRPHLVIGTDSKRGQGLGALATGAHDFSALLSCGEVVLDPLGRAAVLLNTPDQEV